MRLSSIAHLYRVRLKARVVLVQELFAVLGIAVGVALLFASQVASASLDGSVAQLTNGVVGQAKYQLKSRGPQGFSEALLGEVQRLPGVRTAMPVLEAEASVIGPAGSQSVDLIATDPRYVRLAGPLLRHFRAPQLAHQRALALPVPIAEAIGAGPLEPVKLQVGASGRAGPCRRRTERSEHRRARQQSRSRSRRLPTRRGSRGCRGGSRAYSFRRSPDTIVKCRRGCRGWPPDA